jgi:hypothetical protein
MLMIAGFDRAEHMYRRSIGAGEGAIVHHLLTLAPVEAICAVRSATPPLPLLIAEPIP